jgi:hypothetical protein
VTELLWEELPTEEIPVYRPPSPGGLLRVPPYVRQSGPDGTRRR